MYMFYLLHIIINTGIIFFNSSHPDASVILICVFLVTNDVDHLFHVLKIHSYNFFKSFVHF